MTTESITRIGFWVTYAVAFTIASQAANVLSPFAVANSSTANPFLTHSLDASSIRYQQVYRETDFQGSGGLELWITEIGFESSYSANLANVEIRLSSTARYEGDLSSLFDQNFGADAALVYAGALQIQNDPFIRNGFRIPLQTPFLYDRRDGNLLIEVRNYTTGTFPIGPSGPVAVMASHNVVGDGTASAYSFDANSLTAQFRTTEGLSTLFVVTPVPEPSTVSLLLGGIVGALAMVRRRRTRGKQTFS